MPPRAPLQQVTGNCRPSSELSPETRAQICALRDAGQGWVQISSQLQCPESTCRTIYAQHHNTNIYTTKPRKGRPKKLSNREVRHLYVYLRANPKATYQAINRDLALPVSRRSLLDYRKSLHLNHWLAKKRPHLEPKHARARLEWAWQHLGTDFSGWLMSDEVSVEKGKGKKRPWAFGRPGEKWDQDKIHSVKVSGRVSVMAFGTIGRNKRSQLVIFEPGGGYNSESYTEALERGLLPIYEGKAYQQDNAPIRKSRHTLAWFEEHSIYLITDWPPYSPDMNCIEHLWPHLKAELFKLAPDMDSWTGSPESVRQRMVDLLPAAWDAIPTRVFRACMDSMHERMEAVIAADGWQTRF